jgi:hypothetical protein
LARGIAGY